MRPEANEAGGEIQAACYPKSEGVGCLASGTRFGHS